LAQDHQIDPQLDSQLLEEIPGKETAKWNPFSKEKIISMIEKYNNFLTPVSELKTMDLVLFYFIFIVDHKMKKTKCDTVTGHMTGHKNHTPT